MPLNSWDHRFLNEARTWALACSKDPSTQVGAVISDSLHRPISKGYNGFPRGVKDLVSRYEDKSIKYPMVVHAELNAILFADRHDLIGSTLYLWPLPPCADCAGPIIQVGIKRVVWAPDGYLCETHHWSSSVDVARQMFAEAGVKLEEYGW